METIVSLRFGSHLYGTATKESDKDFKGVFMPSREQVLMGKIPKSLCHSTKNGNNGKNSNADIDMQMFSLHHFIHLACEGEMVAMDMLHAPENMILKKSSLWMIIVRNRAKFYTKNIAAFIGYARGQAAKYGIKGSRLNDAEKALKYLKDKLAKENKYDIKLKSLWSHLPEGEHLCKHPEDENGIQMYEVCGRKIGDTVSLGHAIEVIQKFYDTYGERAKQAAENKNIDWKSVSHALRAGYQARQILTEGTITFPLKEAAFLLIVKEGKLDYPSEVAPKLDNLINEIEKLALESSLPEKTDIKFWDKFVMNAVATAINPKESQENFVLVNNYNK